LFKTITRNTKPHVLKLFTVCKFTVHYTLYDDSNDNENDSTVQLQHLEVVSVPLHVQGTHWFCQWCWATYSQLAAHSAVPVLPPEVKPVRKNT